MKHKKYKRLIPFCFWECGSIGINVEDNEGAIVGCYDLTPEDAQTLREELGIALEQFKELENDYEYFG